MSYLDDTQTNVGYSYYNLKYESRIKALKNLIECLEKELKKIKFGNNKITK